MTVAGQTSLRLPPAVAAPRRPLAPPASWFVIPPALLATEANPRSPHCAVIPNARSARVRDLLFSLPFLPALAP